MITELAAGLCGGVEASQNRLEMIRMNGSTDQLECS